MSSHLLSCPSSPPLASGPPRPNLLAPSSPPSCPSRGFIRSLRILYHILEEEGGGRVHVQDIEGLWGGQGILYGVPQALKNATASSGGYLSFPRLVRGLTQALRTGEPPEAEPPKRKVIKGVSRSQSINNDVSSTQRHVRLDRARRHTLTSGIDYNTLRRMKELEQERDTLLDGIQLVERAQEWYKDKLHQAEQQRERVFSKDPPLVPPPPLLGSSLLIQVQEVNRFLSDLVSPSEKGGRRNGPCPIRAPDNLTTLQHHNNLLTRELSAQNQKIWKLQRENEALHKELQSATYTELPSSKSTAERHLHRATFI